MRVSISLPNHSWRIALVAVLTLLVEGCGGPDYGKLVPVSGKVMKGTTPMTSGVVMYLPEGTSDKKKVVSPKGAIQSDGTYVLQTEGKEGAPLGKYKVVIQPLPKEEVQMTNPSKFVPPQPGTTETPKYQNVQETPFTKEVVEGASPGAYDIAILD